MTHPHGEKGKAMTDRLTRRARWVLLLLGLFWLLFWSGASLAQRGFVTQTELKAMQERLEKNAEAANLRDLDFEKRLTRLETQVTAVLESLTRLNNALYGVLGTLVLQIVLNFLPRKETARTEPRASG